MIEITPVKKTMNQPDMMNNESSAVEDHEVQGVILGFLRTILVSGYEVHRCLAAQQLGRLCDADSVLALLERVMDEDEDVAHDAVEALGLLKNKAAVPLLREMYTHADLGDLKVAAVEALGSIGGAEAIETLLQVAGGRGDAWAVVDEEDWDSYWDAQLAAVKALGSLGVEAAVPVIVEVLDDEDAQEMSAAAITALAGCGAAGRAELMKRLRKGSTGERRRAVALLAEGINENSDPTMQKALIEALDDKDGQVRATALNAVEKQLPNDRLAEIGRDKDLTVRLAVIEVLRGRPTGPFTDLWAHLVRDKEPEVRAEAVSALPELMGQKSLAYLLHASKDSHQEVAEAAVQALGVLGSLGGKTAVPAIVGALSEFAVDPDGLPLVRVSAVEAMAGLEMPEAREMLLGLLSDKDPAIRLTSMEALGGLEKERNVPFLLSVLRGEVLSSAESTLADDSDLLKSEALESEEEARIKQDAVSSADETDTAEAEAIKAEAEAAAKADAEAKERGPRSTLESIMQPESADIEAEEPEELDEEMQSYLASYQESLRHNGELLKPKELPPEMDIRILAARMLRETNNPDVLEVLQDVLTETEPELVEVAATALGDLNAVEAFEALLPLLNAERWEVRLAAVRALARLDATRAVEPLLALERDASPPVRAALVEALETPFRNSGMEAVEKLLVNALEDRDPDVVRAAAIVLLKTGRRDVLPDILNKMAADPLHNWGGLGGALAQSEPGKGCEALLKILADPEGEWLFPMAVLLLGEMATKVETTT